MRAPVTTSAGNLLWTRQGSVWAVWVLQGLSYGYKPAEHKDQAAQFHQGLIRSLRGESLWLGVRAVLEPTAVVQRMMDAVDDLSAHPGWAAECEATLDSLADWEIGQRIYFLCRPLVEHSRWRQTSTAFSSATADVKDMLGLPRAVPSSAEVERRLATASRTQELIPAVFQPQPATPAQLAWLDLHAQQRGLWVDDAFPSGNLVSQPTGRSVRWGRSLLDEGGQSDLDGRLAKRGWNPAERRYLKVTQPDRPEGALTSYQTMVTIDEFPAEGMPFPGAEILGNIDNSGIPVDWALRLDVRSSDEAAGKLRRAMRQLNEQFDEREHEVSMWHHELHTTAEDQAEYTQALTADSLEVDARGTVIYAVGGPTSETSREQAQKLSAWLKGPDIKPAIPTGCQEDLWWAMVPGAPVSRTVLDYAHPATSQTWAATVPYASTELGSRTGSLAGLNRTTGLDGVVHHDVVGMARRGIDGSLAIAGDKGGGKSAFLKTLAGDVIDQGGQVVVPDRTSSAEWAQWARSIDGSVITSLADPTFSLCPIRFFGPAVGGQVLQSCVTAMLNLSPSQPKGAQLAKSLRPGYLTEHGISSSGEWAAHLASPGCGLTYADEFAERVAVFSESELGRVIFDTVLPPIPVRWTALVIGTYGVALPTRDQLRHEYDRLGPEKIFGSALYALIIAMARRVCFADRDRLSVFVNDEAAFINSSQEAQDEVELMLRDARRELAALFMGSHDAAADFGSLTQQALIPTRLVVRCLNKQLAARNLAWLDRDPDDEELLKLVTTNLSPISDDGSTPVHRRGEALMADAFGGFGKVKLLVPARAQRAQAVLTNPDEVSAAADHRGS